MSHSAPAVATASALEALLAPARTEILTLLEFGGPASVRRLAAALGRKPGNLYYHLAQLERGGWLTVGARPQGKLGEMVYGRSSLAFDPAAASDLERRSLLGQIGNAQMRQSGRELMSAALAGHLANEGLARRSKLRLTAAARAEIRALLSSLEAVLRREADRNVGEVCSLTLAFLPVAEERAVARPTQG
jgi:DNA-binding transcriptional ArsR family regulator